MCMQKLLRLFVCENPHITQPVQSLPRDQLFEIQDYHKVKSTMQHSCNISILKTVPTVVW